MNFKDIIGPDELDWKKIGKDELKLGTPMSKDGLEANDASCYGILMDDVEKGKHFQARVIVSGCVDFAKAEEYSGIKVSAEAKKAIGKVWSQGGGLTELPEGYPYKEVTVVNEPLNITWDGDIDGKVMGGEGFCKVSDTVLTNEALKAATAVLKSPSGETPIALADRWDASVSQGFITEAISGVIDPDGAPLVVVVRDVASELASGFPETGLYFLTVYEEEYVSALTTTEPVEQRTETIHPMAPEFLPAGMGLLVFSVVLTKNQYGDYEGTMSASYDDVLAAYDAGGIVACHVSGDDFDPALLHCQGYSMFGGLEFRGSIRYQNYAARGIVKVRLDPDGSIFANGFSEPRLLYDETQLFIRSANGSLYAITVDNNGTLSAVKS